MAILSQIGVFLILQYLYEHYSITYNISVNSININNETFF